MAMRLSVQLLLFFLFIFFIHCISSLPSENVVIESSLRDLDAMHELSETELQRDWSDERELLNLKTSVSHNLNISKHAFFFS